jgi:hypothetical protein
MTEIGGQDEKVRRCGCLRCIVVVRCRTATCLVGRGDGVVQGLHDL